ncbi:MAG TPA: hypothetical protein VHD15_02830 [Hyphomicrobiales bacterium]|nr:hypothetical protein [Hyphomicrobiales bacterium]
MDVKKITLAAVGLLGASFVAGCAPGPGPVVYAAPPPAVVVAPRPAIVVRPGLRCRWVMVRGPYHWRRVRQCR